MPEEKNLFEIGNEILAGQAEILAGQAEILNEITGLRNHGAKRDEQIAQMEEKINKLEANQTRQPKDNSSVSPKNNQEIIQTFLKQSKKSWMWAGNNADFRKHKVIAIVSLLILLVVGLTTTIVSSICFKIYSTFTFFENIWMIFGIFYLVYALKAQRIYEVNALASNSSIKYVKDNLGMMLPRKEKVVFRIFKWLAIISVPCNIIANWTGMGKTNQVFATIMEVLFLGALIFAYFANYNLFDQYSIIYVEGHNLTTKERVVLMLPPGAKALMPEEEFKKKMPFFYD